MGGLVAREYIREYGDSKVNKLIMLGTPNNGISQAAKDICLVHHKGNECDDMLSTSNIITNLYTPSYYLL